MERNMLEREILFREILTVNHNPDAIAEVIPSFEFSQDDTKAKQLVYNTVMPSIEAVLKNSTSSADKKKEIVGIIKKIPTVLQTDYVFGWLFLVFQNLVKTNPKLVSSLSQSDLEDITAEIVTLHLFYLDIRDHLAYEKQFKLYTGKNYFLVNDSVIRKIGITVAAIEKTGDKILLPQPVALSKNAKSVKVDRRLSEHDLSFQIFDKLKLGSPPYSQTSKNYWAKLTGHLANSPTNEVTILFTPESGISWDQIAKNKDLLFTSVRFKIKEIEQKRDQQNRKFALQSLKTDIAHYIEIKRRAEQRIAALKEMFSKIQHWDEGKIYCSYRQNKFDIKYWPNNVDYSVSIPVDLQFPVLEKMVWEAQHYGTLKIIYFYDGIIRSDLPDGDDEEIEIPEYSEANCIDFLDRGQEQLFIDCYKSQRKRYADQIIAMAKGAGEVLSAIAEVLNPADPKNVGFLALFKAIKLAKVGASGMKVMKVGAAIGPIMLGRWGVKGVALIESEIARRGRLRIAFAKLSRGIVSKYKQAHHLVTIQALKRTKAVPAAVLDGFKMNEVTNGVLLTTKFHVPVAHWSGYNKWVLETIKTWEKANKGFTNTQARQFLENEFLPMAKKTLKDLEALFQGK